MAILIPAYRPEPALVSLIQGLRKSLAEVPIVVVNDGSGPDFQNIFSEVARVPNVHIVEHAVNLGKGQALKTGINAALLNFPSSQRIVTADADGQHEIADITKIYRHPVDRENEILLGVRSFDRQSTPARSFIGNRLMSAAMYMLAGVALRDTQTGLRGFHIDLAKKFLSIAANRYEFETDVLIWCRRSGVRFVQVPIATVYIDGNRSSHFNPIRDSLNITFSMFRFVLSSLATASLDMVIFAIVHFFTDDLVLSLVAARGVAAFFNFKVNRRAVFKDRSKVWPAALRYLILLVTMTSLTYFVIDAFTDAFDMNVILAKMIAETSIFLVNFVVQRVFVFKQSPADRG